MRVAIVFDCLFPYTKGGGERQYRVFAEEFARAGHEVSYLTRQQWDGDPPADEFRIVPVNGDRDLYDETGTRKPGPAIRFAAGLFRYLRRHRHDYDAVLVSATPATNVLAARAALAGTKVVVGVDWLEVWRPDQWREYSGPVAGRVASLIQRIAVRLSPIATCHSQLTARRLVALNLREAPVVSPGLIDDRVEVQACLTSAQPPRVVYAGRHIRDKRVDALPAAIAHARRSIPDLTATIYGDGKTRGAVLAEIDRLGLSRAVTAPGFVGQEELNRGINTAACLVNPSAREGYGLVVVESCAAGTPIVLVDGEDNAALELIEDGVNGTIAASVMPEDLGAAIVGVVTAGAAMRATTADWFDKARRTRTIRTTAMRILSRFDARLAS